MLMEQLISQRQMIFLSGPRQVGKTTLAQSINQENNGYYLNWDYIADRQKILAGAETIVEHVGLDQLKATPTLIVFDELHKYKHWKNWLKGFFDYYEDKTHILVTGSARMDIFRKGGDSLMGRYFHYRMHPLSLREVTLMPDVSSVLQDLVQPDKQLIEQLLMFGGFPEPYTKSSRSFSNRWQKLRQQQLIYEDIRDVGHIQEIAQLEVLASILKNQAGQVCKYSTLAKQISVSVDTIRRWMDTLESFYYCYRIRPWYKNMTTALRKEPKTYLWDWSQIKDQGAKHENFIASHLLKAVHWWNDLGLGEFDLCYLRTKDQKEADFLVVKDNKPWFLVEVKMSSKQPLNKHLKWFKEKTGAKHAFQVCMDLDYVDVDCFENNSILKVPVANLLMKLV